MSRRQLYSAAKGHPRCSCGAKVSPRWPDIDFSCHDQLVSSRRARRNLCRGTAISCCPRDRTKEGRSLLRTVQRGAGQSARRRQAANQGHPQFGRHDGTEPIEQSQIESWMAAMIPPCAWNRRGSRHAEVLVILRCLTGGHTRARCSVSQQFPGAAQGANRHIKLHF